MANWIRGVIMSKALMVLHHGDDGNHKDELPAVAADDGRRGIDSGHLGYGEFRDWQNVKQGRIYQRQIATQVRMPPIAERGKFLAGS